MAQVGIQTQSLDPPLPLPSSSAMPVKKSSASLGAPSTVTANYSHSELVEKISNLRVLHENHEQQFRQEIQAVQQQQTVELNNLKSSLRNAQEMYEKMMLEREALIQRVRQLEAHHASTAITPQPTAFPQGISSSHTASFVQTVLGIHYEPLGVSQLNHERARPIRLSALQKDKSLVADDSASEKEPRRSSKRNKMPPGYNQWKKQSVPHGDAQMMMENDEEDGLGGEPMDESRYGEEDELTIPLVAKSGTRIRLKPPKGAGAGGSGGFTGAADDDEDASVDLSVHDATYGEKAVTMTSATSTATRAGAKRARSPTSSAQGPAKPTKKRNTASNVARNKINIPVIPRDPDGSPMLPMQVGMFTLRNRGEIRSPEDLATPKALYPAGYKCERRWFSTKDPKALVRYTCVIEGGKDPRRPSFFVIPADAPTQRGHSATAAWWNIYKEGLRVRNQPEQAVMNGDEMFGLHDNVIKALLQELPGADQVQDYVWRTFVEGGPNTKRRSTAHTVYHIETASNPEGWVGQPDNTSSTAAVESGNHQSNSGQMEYDSPSATTPVSSNRVGGYVEG